MTVNALHSQLINLSCVIFWCMKPKCLIKARLFRTTELEPCWMVKIWTNNDLTLYKHCFVQILLSYWIMYRLLVHSSRRSIPGRVLRACAEELAGILTEIFNLTLDCALVPTCFKTTSIVPVPKDSTPTCLNDYCPVALTPIIRKCYEQLVLAHLKSCLPPTLDPHQFA